MKRYGWVRDLPDFRDKIFSLSANAAAVGILPPALLREAVTLPPIYNQGDTSSCTGNGCARAIDHARALQGLPFITPSRLMLYWGARSFDGTTDADCGAQIRNVIKASAEWGGCPESIWPFDPAKVTTRPSETAYMLGALDRAIGYRRVPQGLDLIKQALYQEDHIVFGFSVYASFESAAVAATGLAPLPQTNEPLLGGHCAYIVGYDDAKQIPGVAAPGAVQCDNSWGAEWGDHGTFWLPYGYVTHPQLASDLWTIRLVTP